MPHPKAAAKVGIIADQLLQQHLIKSALRHFGFNVVLTTDPDRLLQSMTGMGKIIMNIGGRIRNKGDKSLSALQVKVGVVDSESAVIKEQKFTIIPSYKKPTLGPSETIDVSVNIGGFTKEDDRANVRWKVTAMKFEE